MHNAVMCKLSLYDVIGITRHLHIKLKSFSNIAQPLHKEAVRGCPFLCIIAKKSGIMSEAFLVDVSIFGSPHWISLGLCIQHVTCDGLFQMFNDAHDSWRLAQNIITS